MPKKANLASALADIGGSTRQKPDIVSVPSADEEQSSEQEVDKYTSSNLYKQPSRIATKPITVHYPQAVRDQLKILAIENNTTLQNLIAEAFNDLFAKYSKPEIAPSHKA